MKLQESGQNYLETILILQERNSCVRSIDIATELGYSKPSISRAVNLLKSNGFINISESGYITFTKDGEQIAKDMYDRHRTLTEFLTKLGVDKNIAAEDACRIEHVISEEAFDKIKQHVKSL
ncbi:MAG TPA: metal-dependent transcriptional regulator [Clostridiales bacterium]|nr:metal-dependent transcriptional regulator [Clostridiales bacterium]